jgi:hypothetical protein
LALHNPGRSHQTQAPLPFNLIESGLAAYRTRGADER